MILTDNELESQDELGQSKNDDMIGYIDLEIDDDLVNLNNTAILEIKKKRGSSSKEFVEVLIDKDMLQDIFQYKWVFSGNYIICSKLKLSLHSYIMNSKKGEIVDHINGDFLDNRKSNLRICTRQENSLNRRKPKNNTSGYKGVNKAGHNGLWSAGITVNKTGYRIGLYGSLIEAAEAYDVAALHYHGKFARLNFPEKLKIYKQRELRKHNWHERFMEMAKLVSSWSKDTTKVGTVIVDYDNIVLSVGYNGFPSLIKDSSDKLLNRELKNAITVHSEVNAILNMSNRFSSSGASVYVFGLPPCNSCSSLLVQNKIRTLILMQSDVNNSHEPWKSQWEISKSILEEAKVKIIYL